MYVFMCMYVSRLLRLIELPSLDGVLSQDVVDGHNIAHNVSSLARKVGEACSSAAQTCLTTLAGGGARGEGSTFSSSASGGSTLLINRPHLLPPPPLAPASHVTRRRSSHLTRSFHSQFQNHFGHRERPRRGQGWFPFRPLCDLVEMRVIS